ncbi:MAG: hypothetical protein GW886_05720 [Rhodobacterales bacterium]|nr:hypothetical protein [Rhodobacterales bacterium]
MELTLPRTSGWSAAPLLSDVWGQVGAVAKCCFLWDGAGARRDAGQPIVAQDLMAGRVIVREAEMALMKTRADWHFLGYGGGVNPLATQVIAAAITVNNVVRVSFGGLPPGAQPDAANLFGFEPRGDRIAELAVPFSYATHAPQIFRATRRSQGYANTDAAPGLPANMAIRVTQATGAGALTLLDQTLTLPAPVLRLWEFEGGEDREAFWCSRAATAMTPDTLILSATGAQVLWRAALPLAAHPLATLRRLSIEEAA